MIEGLMHICRMWGEPGCNPEVTKESGIFETGPAQPAHEWPCGEDQRRLDKVCSSCVSRLFKVRSADCPICEKESLKPTRLIPSYSTGPVKPSLKEFSYRCSICGTLCVSHMNLFAN